MTAALPLTLYRGFDASADIPAFAPAGFDAVFGYVGGADPAHVWTLQEWLRFQTLRQFPIWVDDHETADPVQSAIRCAAAVQARGWANDHTRIVWLDAEETVRPAWVSSFSHTLNAKGYLSGVYGAAHFAAKTGAEDLWIANASVNPGLSGSQVALAYQVDFDVHLGPPTGGTVDISIVSPQAMRLAGVGPRH